MSTLRVVPTVSHLDELEAEAIHIMREVAAELERPVLLFSGGKDSIVLLRLAEKAFRPGKFPFPVMHIDTGHNFPEVIEFRDRRVAELGERLIVASVQESIDKGRVAEETGPRASRNQLQTTTLLDAIEEHQFDVAMGGARRDEERARAKERIFSFRDDFGQWNPRAQRPELWDALQRARPQGRARARVPDLELDRARRVAVRRARAARAAVDLLRARARGVQARRHALFRLRLRRALSRRGAVHRDRALPHRRRHDLHRRRDLATRRSSTTSLPRSPPPASPSAARRARTTASAKPRWRTGSVSATSEHCQPISCGSSRRAPSTTASRP